MRIRGAAWGLVGVAAVILGCRAAPSPRAEREVPTMPLASVPSVASALPPPVTRGTRSLEETLAARRSIREFDPRPLSIADLGQLAWAAQGVTDPALGLRAAPSAGALYPLEQYFVTPTGVLHYLPASHGLERVSDRDLRAALSEAALGQEALQRAPCDVVITSVTTRTRRKYGDRSRRYVDLEAGHAAQNLLLQATARGLGGVPIGAFDDRAVHELLGLTPAEEPVYLLAVGFPATP